MTSKSLAEATGFNVAPRNDMMTGSVVACLTSVWFHYHYHISIVLLVTTTTTTFLLFYCHHRHYHMSIVLLPPSPHFCCFTTAVAITVFLFFYCHHHHLISIVSLPLPPSRISTVHSVSRTPPNFFCFTTPTTITLL